MTKRPGTGRAATVSREADHDPLRTKIVATLGPRSRDEATLRDLITAGVNVIRLNFAHDSAEAHQAVAARARGIADEMKRTVGVLVDLPGPKMRTGAVGSEETTLEAGHEFVLCDDDVEGDKEHVSTSVEGLAGMVSVGDEIFLADGEIVLRCEDVQGGDVRTEIVRGGVLRSRKGMHLPQAERHVEAFTAADEEALRASIEMKADMVGLSFVRDAEDIQRARDVLPRRGHRPLLVAKIETSSAVDNLAKIVPAADVVMVARGDLGIQLPLARVPLIQKEIIRACNEHARPVITATQMLESMTDSPLPTRAEVTDVANAILDGTDALMLSEETAVGHYPIEAVTTMVEIARWAETSMRRGALPSEGGSGDDRVSWAVAHAAVQAAEDLSVAAILCPTRTGATPRRVAAFRPSMPIGGLSSKRETLGALAVSWGVIPLRMRYFKEAREHGEDVERVIEAALAGGLVRSEDLVVVVAGSPGPRAGRTDYVRVVRV